MKRLLGLAVLGMALLAAPVHANGYVAPGRFDFGIRFYGNWGPLGCYGGQGGGGGASPGTYGPWYNYWPLEAHFQVPAHPQYPYWPAPQTLPNGAPVAAPAYSGGYQGHQ